MDSQKKVDMSLDEIIKLNKAQMKKEKSARGGGSARGRGRGRGSRGIGQGRGRGGAANGIKQQQQQQQQNQRGTRRGRGRGFVVNKLNRGSFNQAGQARGRGQAQGRGQARGKGGNRTTMVFTNKTLGQFNTKRGGAMVSQQGQNRGRGQQQQKRGGLVSRQQRLNKVRQQAALLREKQQALKNLQQAQRNMQTVQQAIQQTARDGVVNQRRGLNQGNPQSTRGRKKLLTSLKMQTSNMTALSAASSRKLVHTSVTIANPGAQQRKNNNKRGWRKKPAQGRQEQFTIQVPNERTQGGNAQTQSQSQILNQLKMLKPAVPTVYKFQKNVFAAPKTGLTLNDRFGSTSSLASAGSGDAGVGLDRKVFM